MTQVVYEDGAPVLRSDWHPEDILSIDPSLSEEQVLDVMQLIARTHDANIGINWMVIEVAIQNIKEAT